MSDKETLSFQAEVQQLLHLMIHSLYTHKEIFLREMISNASDACDKLRFEALTRDGLLGEDTELRIRVDCDREARTVTVEDNGIGMTRQEVIDNIGTIARSGTREFLSKLTGDAAEDAHLIGQFGVGFYSSFVVADRVTVETRRADVPSGEGVRWESTGEGEYSLETVERTARGTLVTLHMREGEDEFLDPLRLRAIIHKYSDHIALPIRMPELEEGKRVEDRCETVNRASAFWARPPKEISDEEYREFYKHVAHDFEDPLAWTHHRVEGKLEYQLLLYVPARAPFDLWDREQRRGVKLYVRRVFITEDAEPLMPRYLRFVRGVIDSGDLPLNISRETLQSSRVVDSIRSGASRRVLDMLEELRDTKPDEYRKLWAQFGRVLKEGPAEDPANAEQIAKLLLFATTRSEGAAQTTSLKDYVARMQPGQAHIYYLSADSFAAARSSPHLEVFRAKDIEVLLLYDRVDEWLVAALTEFDGKPLRSVARGDLDLGGIHQTDETAQEQLEEEFREFVARVRSILGERVGDVRLSQRLKDSPACVIAPEGALGRRLERLLREVGQDVPGSKPILELNPSHPIVLKARHDDDKERFKQWCHLLLDQAILAEGGELEDPAGFVQRLNELLVAIAG